MSIQINELQVSPAAGAGVADAFLHVQTRRAGKIKGEVISPGHADDIALTGWNWGLNTASAVGSTQATGRRSYTALTVHKNVDAATTALMSALASNDEVKEAKLTMRRAGGEQEDYFTIKLSGARISQVLHTADAAGNVYETVAIAFNKVEVEYRPQKSSGLRSGSSMFMDEILPA
jgi:type VI secretion system secreted protein Hcp